MFSRSASVKITDGVAAGIQSTVSGEFSVGADWDDDITLIDAEPDFEKSTFKLSGLIEPKLKLVSGAAVGGPDGQVEAGQATVMGRGANSFRIGGLSIEITPHDRINKDKAVRALRAGLTRRHAMAAAGIAGAIIVTAVGIYPALVTGDEAEFIPAKTEAGFGSTNYWSTVTQMEGERFSLPMSVIESKLEKYRLSDKLDVDRQAKGQALVLSGTLALSDTDKLDRFRDWYSKTGERAPLIENISIATTQNRPDLPAIEMILTIGTPKLVLDTGAAVFLGERTPGGWLFSDYIDGTVILETGGERVEIRAFRN